jgi:Ca-activated chloride channel family protein
MQRWHVTFGLATLALLGAALAPRLMKAGTAEAAAEAPVVPPAAPESAVEPDPARSGHLVVSAGLDRTAVAAGATSERYLVVTVAAPADATTRKPVDLTVVVDTSGSMKRQGKMEMARAATLALGGALGPQDELAIVGFAEYASVMMYPSPGGDAEGLRRAVSWLTPGGETNLGSGLEAARGQVFSGISTGEKRVVVVSDGYPTVGDKSASGLAKLADDLRREGVAVSTIGLGVDFDEDLLVGVSAAGGGRYTFADDANELSEAFRRELARTATLVASDTKVRVEIPDGVELIEFVGRTATKDGHAWLVDVGSVSAGELRKVVARVRVTAGAPGSTPVARVSATWDDRLDHAPGHASVGVSASVVTAVAEAEQSYDEKNNVAANEARGGWFMDRAARAYARGDADEAQRIAGQARAELAAPMAATPSPSLEKLDDTLAVQADAYDAPAAAEPSRRVVLEAKATAMDYAE